MSHRNMRNSQLTSDIPNRSNPFRRLVVWVSLLIGIAALCRSVIAQSYTRCPGAAGGGAGGGGAAGGSGGPCGDCCGAGGGGAGGGGGGGAGSGGAGGSGTGPKGGGTTPNPIKYYNGE